MSDLIESCMEFVRRIASCLIHLGGGAKVFLRRIARYLIEQSAVRSFLGELRGI